MLVYKHIPYIVTIFVINKLKIKELFVFYLIVVVSDTQIINKKQIINYLFLYFVNSYDFINYITCILIISLWDDWFQSIYVFMAFIYYFYSNLYIGDLAYLKFVIALLSIICNVRLHISFIMILRMYMILSIERVLSLHNYIVSLEVLHHICNCVFLMI